MKHKAWQKNIPRVGCKTLVTAKTFIISLYPRRNQISISLSLSVPSDNVTVFAVCLLNCQSPLDNGFALHSHHIESKRSRTTPACFKNITPAPSHFLLRQKHSVPLLPAALRALRSKKCEETFLSRSPANANDFSPKLVLCFATTIDVVTIARNRVRTAQETAQNCQVLACLRTDANSISQRTLAFGMLSINSIMVIHPPATTNNHATAWHYREGWSIVRQILFNGIANYRVNMLKSYATTQV